MVSEPVKVLVPTVDFWYHFNNANITPDFKTNNTVFTGLCEIIAVCYKLELKFI